MVQIRVKHADPTARISHATSSDPDEKGGFMVDDKHLVSAGDHGWRVVHWDYDEADVKHQEEQAKVEEEAAAAIRQRLAEDKIIANGGLKDPDFSGDGDEVEEDDPDAPSEPDGTKKKRRLPRRKA